MFTAVIARPLNDFSLRDTLIAANAIAGDLLVAVLVERMYNKGFCCYKLAYATLNSFFLKIWKNIKQDSR